MINGSEDDVFVILEGWSIPGTFDKFADYRIKVLKILEPFEPEYLFYCHPFDWAYDSEDDDYPTGVEICRFRNEETARRAIEAINSSGIREMEKEVSFKVRSYMGRFATKEKWDDHIKTD